MSHSWRATNCTRHSTPLQPANVNGVEAASRVACVGSRWRRRMASGLLEAVRGLWLADPNLSPKPLPAKLREQQSDLGAGTKEVREALAALKAEAAAATPPAADSGGAPSDLALSLACLSCARLPSDMNEDREKHLVSCVSEVRQVQDADEVQYWCCVSCPETLALGGVLQRES